MSVHIQAIPPSFSTSASAEISSRPDRAEFRSWPMENLCGSERFSRSGLVGKSDSTLTWRISRPTKKVHLIGNCRDIIIYQFTNFQEYRVKCSKVCFDFSKIEYPFQIKKSTCEHDNYKIFTFQGHCSTSCTSFYSSFREN